VHLRGKNNIAKCALLSLEPRQRTAAPVSRNGRHQSPSGQKATLSTGCSGNASIRARNLDRMAASGMRFERAYVSCPQCSPTRSSIFTGWALHTSLPPWEPTIIDALKERGYFTSILKKHHQGAHFEGRLDFYHAEIDFAKFFSALPARRPFFLQVGFTDPHRPYRKDAPGGQNGDRAKWGQARSFSRAAKFEPVPILHDPRSVVVPPGELLKELERRGLTENTMLVFTGDGEDAGEEPAGVAQRRPVAGAHVRIRGTQLAQQLRSHAYCCI
jgi:arylsulfatase A-like enzyme